MNDFNDICFMSGTEFSIDFNAVDIEETPVTISPVFEILKKGRVVKTFLPKSNNLFSFDLSFLKEGRYAYRIMNEEVIVQSGKIVVIPVSKQ